MATEIDPLAFQKGYQASQGMFDSARQNRLQDLVLAQKEREIGQTNALNDLYRNAVSPEGTIDRTKLISGAASAGLGSQIPALTKSLNEQDKVANESRKAQLEAGLKQFEAMGQLFSGVRDQASYDMARQQAVSIIGPEAAARIPAVYDANQISQGQAQALSVKDRMAQELQRMQFTETQRHNQTSEGLTAQGQQLTLRGQNLTAETARRGQDLTATAAAAKPAQKEAEAQTQRVKDANDALGLLDQAEKLVPSSTGSYIGAGVDAAAAAFGKSTEGAKSAAQLKAIEGMLVSKMPKMSGPQSDKDVAMYRQMAGTIGDPTIPGDTKLAAIKTIREIQNKYAGNSAAPTAPTKPAGAAQPDALAELQRRAATDPALAAKLKAMGY